MLYEDELTERRERKKCCEKKNEVSKTGEGGGFLKWRWLTAIHIQNTIMYRPINGGVSLAPYRLKRFGAVQVLERSRWRRESKNGESECHRQKTAGSERNGRAVRCSDASKPSNSTALVRSTVFFASNFLFDVHYPARWTTTNKNSQLLVRRLCEKALVGGFFFQPKIDRHSLPFFLFFFQKRFFSFYFLFWVFLLPACLLLCVFNCSSVYVYAGLFNLHRHALFERCWYIKKYSTVHHRHQSWSLSQHIIRKMKTIAIQTQKLWKVVMKVWKAAAYITTK